MCIRDRNGAVAPLFIECEFASIQVHIEQPLSNRRILSYNEFQDVDAICISENIWLDMGLSARYNLSSMVLAVNLTITVVEVTSV